MQFDASKKQAQDILSQEAGLRPGAPGDSDGLRISMLASGSTGNATYVETHRARLLIDAGLSGKKIEGLMAQINRQVQDLDAILVTHEHRDHIHGVGVLSRKYDLPVYANRQTWQAMDKVVGKIAPHNRRYFEHEELLSFADIDVLSYHVSHDAVEPQFYALQKGGKQFVMLTDTGYVSQRLQSMLANADAYLIESNHEIDMLRYGNYPWSLKQRILSDKGHLSNEDGALAITRLMGPSTKDVFLGHLSQDNNTKHLALSSMETILRQHDVDVYQEIQLHMTDPDQATDLFDL